MQTPKTYETIPQQVLVLIWPEADLTDLARLVGPENVVRTGQAIEVHNSDGQWVTLRPGWAVAVGLNHLKSRHVLSPSAFTDWLRPRLDK
jgi:hypothetical protein